MTDGITLPLGKPTIEGAELDYVAEAVRSGRISSGGQFTQRCVDLLREQLDAAEVLLTTSCTDALEMSAMLLDLGPGDKVVVPSFTFVSTALAFARTGAEIVFCDIEPHTLGMDPAHLESLLDDRVRAVVPVHYAGVAARIDQVEAVVSQHEISIVEDNAHGLFGSWRGRPLGSFGRMSTLSFHETKNFVCGEGGALVLNDAGDVDRAHILLDKGTNRRAFFDGEVDKYTWMDTGSSFGLSEILAAYLWAQLENRASVLDRRRRVHELYDIMLAPVAAAHDVRLPVVPEGCTPGFHMYYVLLPENTDRTQVLEHLRDDGIKGAFHYVPLHSSPGARMVTSGSSTCPVTDDIASRLLRLPFHNDLQGADVARVVTSLSDALERCAGSSAGERMKPMSTQV